ncbi:hypothetical protein TSOC_000282 [Tetrabaena socialis]|uniref:Uncharacterized protein n=1 Tax=Tetrabaena socialis TaxID=47790 RepID=A0A2J8AJR5_9CHLO|nr:hypothetical protein TSOC_000282 [Tetrabaena socialis]|eukprot:PNH12765.1 hypothetical protein TSOC_000282 [Tetrabaena socialis]
MSLGSLQPSVLLARFGSAARWCLVRQLETGNDADAGAEALNRLRQTTTALVDRALSPAAYTANPHARLVGVGAACMPAPPALGGFGLLPLVEHVRGRHAALAARCLTGACPGLGSFQPPWALVALALLRHLHHAATPLCLLTARVLPAQGARRASVLVLGRPVPSTCPALIQLASAFSALPPPLILPSPALEPGPWCFNMPLWGNPFLPGATAGQSLEADFADLAGIRGFNTVGMAVRCCAAMTALLLTAPITPPGQPVNPAVARHLTLAYHATVLRGILQVEPAALPPALRSFPTALARFIALHPRLPPAWCAAAGVVADVPGGAAAAPAAPVVWSLLLRHLGWRLGTTVIPLLTLTVKQATQKFTGGDTFEFVSVMVPRNPFTWLSGVSNRIEANLANARSIKNAEEAQGPAV